MFGMNLVVLLSYGFLLRPEEPTNFILGLLAAILIILGDLTLTSILIMKKLNHLYQNLIIILVY